MRFYKIGTWSLHCSVAPHRLQQWQYIVLVGGQDFNLLG